MIPDGQESMMLTPFRMNDDTWPAPSEKWSGKTDPVSATVAVAASNVAKSTKEAFVDQYGNSDRALASLQAAQDQLNYYRQAAAVAWRHHAQAAAPIPKEKSVETREYLEQQRDIRYQWTARWTALLNWLTGLSITA